MGLLELQAPLPVQLTLQAAPALQATSSMQAPGPLQSMLQSLSELQLTLVVQETSPTQLILQGEPSLWHETTPLQPPS